jgi:hypothetical protein
MHRVVTTVFAGVVLAAGALGQAGAQVSVEAMPPSVVKTVPQAGEKNVDPSLTEVRATFSKDMMTDRMWSWAMNSRETFPEIDANKIRYLGDRRTCVLPVKLKPNKTYVIWINSQKYNSFRDTANHPAVPYLLVFQTGAKRSSARRDAENAAVQTAGAWLTLVDNARYAASWDQAAGVFKGAVTKKQWPAVVQQVRKPLGKMISRRMTSRTYRTSLPGVPDGQYVVIQYETSFEKKKSAVETVTPMLDKDGKWRVSGYYIR